MDELGAGTDPGGGRRPGRRHHREAPGSWDALVAATTHYAELKVYAMTTRGWRTPPVSSMWRPWPHLPACLSVSPESPTPLPSPERLGLPKYIIDKAAAARIDAENVRFEDVPHPAGRAAPGDGEGEGAPPESSGGEMEESLEDRPGVPGQTGGRRGPRRWREPGLRPSAIRTRPGTPPTKCSRSSTACAAARERGRLAGRSTTRAALRRSLSRLREALGGPRGARSPTRPARAGDTVELVKMGSLGQRPVRQQGRLPPSSTGRGF
ncbi:MAG: hypothetical protein ACLRWQ_21630 [Flavonifractor plautii]